MENEYNNTGAMYNHTRHADPYLTDRLLHLLDAAPGGDYLDIGCGTGNYTIALAASGLNLTGVDPSGEMLNEARKRDQSITWLKGAAEEIPAKEVAFDGVIAVLTIHHWTDLVKSMKEIYRVTRPGGRIVLFTATPQQMKGYWLNHYFPAMMRASADQMPGFYAVATALANAGFDLDATEKYYIKEDLQDHFLYSGKHQPEMYLDEEMRKGISSFTVLANEEEVAAGLAKLNADINNGEFEDIRDSFENNKGDYLFVVAKKK